MNSRILFPIASGVVLLAVQGAFAAETSGAADILAAAKARRGLCLHLGCGRAASAALTADLAAGGELLVHGLALDDASAARAREAVTARGLGGRAAVEKLPVAPLPYAVDLANVVVIEDWAALSAAGLTAEEVLRVTAPGGAVCKLESGAWKATVKPRPAGMDDWTHPTRGPDGNRHSRDRVVGFPVGVRWQAGMPMNFTLWAAVRGWVVAGGRCYVFSSTQWENLERRAACQEYLEVRDAYNGLPLWRVNCESLNDGRALNAHNLAPLAADERAVYVTSRGKLTAFDGATGRLLRTYATKHRPMKVCLADGVLAATCWSGVRVGGLWGEWNPDGNGGAVHAFEVETGKEKWSLPQPARYMLLAGGRAILSFPAGTVAQEAVIVAADLGSGKELWRVSEKELGGQSGGGPPASAAQVPDGKVEPAPATRAAPKPAALEDLSGSSGARAGQAPPLRPAPKGKGINGDMDLLCADAAVVVVALPQDVRTVVLSAVDGRELWESKEYAGAVLAGDQVWLGKTVRDGKTGQVKGDLPAGIRSARASAPCTPVTIVDSRILMESRGCKYFDLSASTGQPKQYDYKAARGACGEGATPANGMFYTAQNRCRCAPNQVPGFLAFGPCGKAADANDMKADRPTEKGRAPVDASAAKAADANGDWPMYRHDAARGGAASGNAPRGAKVLWTAPLGDAGKHWLVEEWRDAFGEAITPPVAAAGLVVIARGEQGQIVALSAADGKVRWRADVPGRIDSPPTLHRGLCIAGSHDGWVYAFDAGDGRLAWRSRAEPLVRRVVAFGQVESVWPATGSVLAADGKVWVLAGRSCDSDGGLALCEFDAASGACISAAASGMGGHLDLLAGGAGGKVTKVKLLDKSWKSYGDRNRTASPGLSVSAGAETFTCDGKVVACVRAAAPGLPAPAAPVPGKPGPKGKPAPAWRFPPAPAAPVAGAAPVAPAQRGPSPYCLIACQDAVIAGGTEPGGGTDGGAARGVVWLLARTDGSLMARIDLPAPPVADGIALAGGRLLVSLTNGSVLCLGEAK